MEEPRDADVLERLPPWVRTLLELKRRAAEEKEEPPPGEKRAEEGT